jgi:hypothetical protein
MPVLVESMYLRFYAERLTVMTVNLFLFYSQVWGTHHRIFCLCCNKKNSRKATDISNYFP